MSPARRVRSSTGSFVSRTIELGLHSIPGPISDVDCDELVLASCLSGSLAQVLDKSCTDRSAIVDEKVARHAVTEMDAE